MELADWEVLKPLSVCTPYSAFAGISREPNKSLSTRVSSVFINIRFKF